MVSRILIVSEDTHSTPDLLLQKHLEQKGFEVKLVASDLKDLAQIQALIDERQFIPNLVILNLDRLREDILELYSKLKVRLSIHTVPVLVYAKEASVELVLATYRAGADYYVPRNSYGSFSLLDQLVNSILSNG